MLRAGSHGVDDLPAFVRLLLLLLLLSRCVVWRALALDAPAGAQLWQMHRATPLIYRRCTDKATNVDARSSWMCYMQSCTRDPCDIRWAPAAQRERGGMQHARGRFAARRHPSADSGACCARVSACTRCVCTAGNALVACPHNLAMPRLRPRTLTSDYPVPQVCGTIHLRHAACDSNYGVKTGPLPFD
jgi:hypothetical protein